MSFSYSPKIVTDGLVLYLDAANTRSYPTTGTSWLDLSKQSNQGTLVNSPTFNASNNGSIVFDGIDDYVISNNNINISSNQARTIDVWFYLNNSTNRHVLCSWGGFNNALLCNLEVNQVIGANTNYPYFASFNNDAYVSQTISINSWTNLTLTYGGGTINSPTGLIFYINGVSRSIIFPNNNLSLSTSNTQVYLGYEGAGNRNPMSGRISNCKIYNRVLSSQEVQQNYNTTKSRFGLS